MPRGDTQEVRVLTAGFKPGDKTVFHTHRFPVIVCVLEGSFTLELEGRAPLTVKASEAMVEPPNVKMTGYNRSATEPLRVSSTPAIPTPRSSISSRRGSRQSARPRGPAEGILPECQCRRHPGGTWVQQQRSFDGIEHRGPGRGGWHRRERTQ
jgi:quercetin dioxygenase-like cupin family protein